MSVGWFTNLADAEAYFTNERYETAAWDVLTNAQKTKAVTMAYNRIYYCGAYNVPTPALATPDQLVILKKANGEMAYYLVVNLADEDKRKGIQVQGTVQAGIVQESYAKSKLNSLPIPAIVDEMLSAGGFSALKGLIIKDLGRNENYHVYNEDNLYNDLL